MNEHEGRPAMDSGASARLVPLRSLSGYRLAAGEPDIRGWEVRDRDGGRLGVVEDLLIDADTSEVAALAVASGPGVSVVLMNEAHRDVMRWNFEGGWINKIEGPGLNAAQNEVAIEAMEICHEALTFELEATA